MSAVEAVREIPTDVLIVGGGGAGLRAAIAAREAAADVIVASKTAAGQENCTAYAHGGFTGAVGGLPSEGYLRQLAEQSEGLADPALAHLLAERSGTELGDLKRLGVDLSIREGGATVSARPMRSGEGLTLPLRRFAEGLGAAFHEPVQVAQIMLDDGAVMGALAADLSDGSLLAYRCPCVIMATGGFADAYARSDNPGRTTGDGIYLAVQAGAQTVDMEFLQTFGLGLAEQGLPYDGCNFGPALAAGQLTTLDGDPVPRQEVESIKQGRSWPVERDDERFDFRLDLTDVPDDTWSGEIALSQIRELLLGDFPVGEQPVRVAPLAHYTTGGVRIDTRCRTGVEGLLAAGEVTGGVFGARRPGGAALTEVIVFGAIAGREAAAVAKAARGRWSERVCREAELRLRALMAGRPSTPSPSELLAEVGWALWNHCFEYRHEQGLKRCLARLEELREPLAQARASTVDELATLVEARAAHEVAIRAATSSLSRRQTLRGHRRLDHPQEA
ncbi:MAG: FAD-binding protein [Armatimonadota bacterium]